MNSRLVALVDYWTNRVITARYNPFYYLGQISIFLLVLILLSGIYLLPFYRINVERAYDAVQYITVEQWYLGGIMRSIHRYASDALIITLLIHGLRLLLLGKFRFNRWLIWVTGVMLFGFILIQGITGYWMVWDERAQLVAISTTEFLDILPIFPKPLARAFIGEEAVTNLLFFAVIFIHVGGTLLLIGLLLLHFSRFSRTRWLPKRGIWVVILLMMLGLSLIKPALSAPPADLTKVPVNVPVDWFYLFLLPLVNSDYHGYAWLLLIAVSLAILVPPWIKRGTRPMTAIVVEEKCVGCELCYRDCPYGAINMIREGRKRSLAVISESLCSSCGTCLGSCNFSAIQVKGMDVEEMKLEIDNLLARDEEPQLLGIVCEHAFNVKEHVDGRGRMLGIDSVIVLPLRCIGMVNPFIISHALDTGTAGLFIVGCKMDDCHYRLGNKWLKDRIEGSRAPVLKDKRLDRIRTYWISPHESGEFLDKIRGFKEELRIHEVSRALPVEEIRKSMLPAVALLLLLPALLIGYFSESPAYSLVEEDEAILLFTMHHRGERIEPCIEPTVEELKAGNYTPCKRKRVPVIVELDIDGLNVLSKAYDPQGIRKDGPSFAYEKIKIPSGTHSITIRIRDSRAERFNYNFDQTLEFKAGRIVVIDFEDKRFII
jgi:coenzyme F420-reducing hydrogenase delta subunit/quinol-cytochrome oxidoreductase complex cytochrome b subunit